MMYYRITQKPPDTTLVVDRGIIYFKTPYHWQDFLDDMKAVIPGHERRWYPGKAVWAFREEDLDVIKSLVLESFGSEPTIERIEQ